jgi:hypothetical protein
MMPLKMTNVNIKRLTKMNEMCLRPRILKHPNSFTGVHCDLPANLYVVVLTSKRQKIGRRRRRRRRSDKRSV